MSLIDTPFWVEWPLCYMLEPKQHIFVPWWINVQDKCQLIQSTVQCQR